MELDADMYDESPPSPSTIRENALHLVGVDDMSASDVHTYLSIYHTDSKPRIEWIDDTCLNLVYYTSDDARVALAHLTTVPTNGITTKERAAAKPNPQKPDARLEIRYAMYSDRKIAGAKDRSRYYLFHPEDDPDSRIRTQKKRARNSHEPYSTTRRTLSKRDLFADRLIDSTTSSHRPVIRTDLFQSGEKTKVSGEDLFAARVLEASKHSGRKEEAKRIASRLAALPATDLFADRAQSSRPLAERISSSSNAVPKKDLFTDRIRSGGSDLASRISGGPVRNKGVHMKGRAKAADLY